MERHICSCPEQRVRYIEGKRSQDATENHKGQEVVEGYISSRHIKEQ